MTQEKHLFLFYTGDANLVSSSSGIDNAISEQAYLSTRYNHIHVVSFIGQSYDDCWIAADMFHSHVQRQIMRQRSCFLWELYLL